MILNLICKYWYAYFYFDYDFFTKKKKSHKQTNKLCQPKRYIRNNDNSTAMSNPGAQFVISKYHFPLKRIKDPWRSGG